MQYYSAMKKNEIMPFAATWMQLEITILINQKEKDKYHITYMWNLKYDRNAPIYEAETDIQTENRLVIIKGRVREGYPGGLGLVDANYYIPNGWTTRFLLYTGKIYSGKYIQCPGRAIMEKYEKNVPIHVQLSHFAL